jgi:hypothetical protein
VYDPFGNLKLPYILSGKGSIASRLEIGYEQPLERKALEAVFSMSDFFEIII